MWKISFYKDNKCLIKITLIKNNINKLILIRLKMVFKIIIKQNKRSYYW